MKTVFLLTILLSVALSQETAAASTQCLKSCGDIHRLCTISCKCPLGLPDSCLSNSNQSKCTSCSALPTDLSQCIDKCLDMDAKCRTSCCGSDETIVKPGPTPSAPPLPRCSKNAIGESFYGQINVDKPCTLPSYCRAVLERSFENGRLVIRAGYRIQSGPDGSSGDIKVPLASKNNLRKTTRADTDKMARGLLERSAKVLAEYGCELDVDTVSEAVYNGLTQVARPNTCANTSDDKCVQMERITICPIECRQSDEERDVPILK